MDKKTAGTSPYEDATGPSGNPWTSIPFDEAYEKKIFELECYIDRLEYLLIIAEMDLNQKNRENCA